MGHINDETVKYSLSASAREAFFKFSKAPETVTPSKSSTPEVKQPSSKRNKQVLCVAINMHVLYERLRKALAHQTGPTDRTISLVTMNMAINLVNTLETYKGILETVSLFKVVDVDKKVVLQYHFSLIVE